MFFRSQNLRPQELLYFQINSVGTQYKKLKNLAFEFINAYKPSYKFSEIIY